MTYQRNCLFVVLLLLSSGTIRSAEQTSPTQWISALDRNKVQYKGSWNKEAFRNAIVNHLHTTQNGSQLELEFSGTAIALRLGGHNLPPYGAINGGSLHISIDEVDLKTIDLRDSPREIVLARGLAVGQHRLRLTHVASNDMSGCRIEGFRVWTGAHGELQFSVHGEKNSFLTDVRLTLRRKNQVVRSTISRNWLTGQCSLVGLPSANDYSLEVQALGWQTARRTGISIRAGTPSKLPSIYLRRDCSTTIHRTHFPALNRPTIHRPGQSFRARFLGFNTTIDEVRLTRQVGPATISRILKFKEDRAAAYYYDREIVATLPNDMSPGAYDLSITVSGGTRSGICRSPRSVHVINEFPTDPVLVTFGHLDTSAQYQAEYLQRMATTINLIAPDLVLNSNAVNPGYISGALSHLDMPYLITFGNHQFRGHQAWYGEPVNRVDFGPNWSILNFGHPWHVDTSQAEALLSEKANTQLKIINGFESNAPLSLLNKHHVAMIHDGHGPGKRVMNIGTTPTRRIGKTNSASFRVVRFQSGRVASCTYNGHESAPYPFSRSDQSMLRAVFSTANDGTSEVVLATVTNNYLEDFPRGRLTFVLPAGRYQTNIGKIESAILSDDGKYTVVSVRVNFSRQKQTRVQVSPQ